MKDALGKDYPIEHPPGFRFLKQKIGVALVYVQGDGFVHDKRRSDLQDLVVFKLVRPP